MEKYTKAKDGQSRNRDAQRRFREHQLAQGRRQRVLYLTDEEAERVRAYIETCRRAEATTA